MSEILVLVNRSLLALKELKASLFLCLEALDSGRSEAVCAEVLANLNGVCGVVVGASEKEVSMGEASMAAEEEYTYVCLDETAGG